MDRSRPSIHLREICVCVYDGSLVCFVVVVVDWIIEIITKYNYIINFEYQMIFLVVVMIILLFLFCMWMNKYILVSLPCPRTHIHMYVQKSFSPNSNAKRKFEIWIWIQHVSKWMCVVIFDGFTERKVNFKCARFCIVFGNMLTADINLKFCKKETKNKSTKKKNKRTELSKVHGRTRRGTHE